MKTCKICGGTVSSGTANSICSYCISARASTAAAKDTIAPHICGCINADRKNCPLCNKPCHHDTSLSPKILILPM